MLSRKIKTGLLTCYNWDRYDQPKIRRQWLHFQCLHSCRKFSTLRFSQSMWRAFTHGLYSITLCANVGFNLEKLLERVEYKKYTKSHKKSGAKLKELLFQWSRNLEWESNMRFSIPFSRWVKQEDHSCTTIFSFICETNRFDSGQEDKNTKGLLRQGISRKVGDQKTWWKWKQGGKFWEKTYVP